jgi:nucleoside-diphosphate-sugar epimerase
MPRKALITGATGFVGSHLVRRLADDGWSVDALVRRDNADLPQGVRARRDPGDVDGLTELVGKIRPEVCFHLATEFRGVHVPADIAPMIEGNIHFGNRLAQAVSQTGDCLFLNLGTVWQHYDARAYSPVSLYAATKQAFADLLVFYSEVEALPVVTLELTDTYGPDDPRAKLVPVLAKAVRDGTTLEMTDGTQLIDLVYIDDAVEAILATAAGDPGSTYGATSGAHVDLRALVAAVERAAGHPIDVRWGVRPSRPREMLTDWTVSPPPPGWRPKVDLDEGLARVLAAQRPAGGSLPTRR